MGSKQSHEYSTEELKKIIYRKNLEVLQHSLYLKGKSAKPKTTQKLKRAKHLVFELDGKQFTL